MKTWLAAILLLSFTGLCLELPAGAVKGAANPQAAITLNISAIDTYMQAMLRAWNIPGAALVIVQGDQVVYQQGYGRADASGRHVTAQTPFEIGSCSKSFTALAIMQLVEQGGLELGAPVQRYLPWFRVADPEASAGITVRHLLNHSSGIPALQPRTMVNPDSLSLEDQVRSLANIALSYPPGAMYQYSNLNYMALGLLIEKVSGQKYGKYLADKIFTPIDMRNSFTDISLARQNGLSDGHTWWFGMPLLSLETPRPDMLGAGYVMTSAEDMGHYLVAQINGGTFHQASVLSPAGTELMHQPTQLTEQLSEYGMGWTQQIRDGAINIQHGGQSASFNCSMVLLPDQKIGLAVLANVTSLLGPLPAYTMGEEVKRMLLSGQPGSVSSGFRDAFLPWDAGFLLVTGLVAWSATAGFQKWRKQLKAHPANSRKEAWRRVYLPAGLDGAIGLAVLLGLPLAVGFEKWQGMFVWQPDATIWCLVIGVIMLGQGTARLLVAKSRTKSVEKQA